MLSPGFRCDFCGRWGRSQCTVRFLLPRLPNLGGLGPPCHRLTPPSGVPACLQRCCHCCLLGREAQAKGQSCEYNLMVGYQCGLVFRACCVKGQETTDFAPADNGDHQETGNSPPPFLSGSAWPGLSRERFMLRKWLMRLWALVV